MKVSLSPIGLAFVVSVYLGFSANARAQDGAPPLPASRALAATVDYGNDALFQPEKQGTDFSQLGLDPEQTVNVTVQFPTEMAGLHLRYCVEQKNRNARQRPDDRLQHV